MSSRFMTLSSPNNDVSVSDVVLPTSGFWVEPEPFLPLRFFAEAIRELA